MLFVSVRWLGADVNVIFSFSLFSPFKGFVFGLKGVGVYPPTYVPPRSTSETKESIKMKRKFSSISIPESWPQSKVLRLRLPTTSERISFVKPENVF